MAGYKSNLNSVSDHLEENEEIIHSVDGVFTGKTLGQETLRTGVMIVTRSRVVFFSKRLFGFDLETVSLKGVTSVEMSKGMIGKKIRIITANNEITMSNIQRGEPDELVRFVNENMGRETGPKTFQSGSDVPSKLRDLKELRDADIITEDEFERKKTELLSMM